ncbi:MAG: ATP-binding protein [Bacteroidota bacterium]|nr:ATP-binding protein [Bacteroidota bacterium]
MNTNTQGSGALHDSSNSDKILRMTADTMFLIDMNGICVDMVLHTDRWFLQNTTRFIGKSIFDSLPSETAIAFKNNFDKVVSTGLTSTDNYEMQISGKTYYFKCIIYRYDDNYILLQYRDITKRILLKQNLEKANLQLQEIEKVAMIGHWQYNTENEVFYYTGIFGAKSSGTEYETITKNDLLETIYPEDKAIFLDYLKEENKIALSETHTCRIILKDKLYYLLFKIISAYHENGIKFMEGYVQNISDIKENQHRLEIVTAAVSNSNDLIFAMKTDGKLVFGNKRFNEQYGWKADEDISSYNIFSLKNSWAGGKRWAEVIKQAISSDQVVNFVLNKPDYLGGEAQTLDCTSYLTKDSTGTNLVWTFGKDITERVHYEKQVKELNQIMSSVLSNIPMYISVKDISNDFRYIFSNREAGDFRAGQTGQIIGKSDFDIFPADLAESIRNDDLKVMQNNGEHRRIIEDTDENGNKRLTDQLRIIIKDEMRPLLITIEQNITKSKEMEQDLVEAKERAIEADKLKSAFIANMSHEIRTPLNAIVGFSKIIAETENSEDRNSYYAIVEANNERLLGLINEILDLSKIESGIMAFDNAPINLSDFSEDLIHTMSIKCPEGVRLIYEPCDKDLTIFCDRNRLSQVFTNLINNAIKFTTKGSITFGFNKTTNSLEFFVRDTGKGIAPDQLDKVFDRFVKADNFTQGTGLGLSICRSIIERMGGTIKVESQLGKGAAFRFTLPNSCIITDKIIESNAYLADAPFIPQNKTILVAEDTDSNFKLIEAMIGKMYRLIRANNGVEAISMCCDLHPDLILMDIKMPEMNGLEATLIIREANKEIPIIAQSAFAFEDDRKRAIDCGCTDFIAKPFTKKQLSDVIIRHLPRS